MKKPKYTKKEIKAFEKRTDDFEFDWDRLPFWTKVRWIMNPPQSTGPR